MKKAIKFTPLLILTLLLTTYSCSDDDEVNVITLQDLTVSIDENPTNGDVVGTVEATQTVGGATLTYSMTSQTPAGAIGIDASTGELTVADATLFDFETNPTITATVSADEAQNTASVTITVNNINELSSQDFTATIDENPTNGDTIGTVQASGDGTLSYSITSQTPAGALNIDANTGELSVADPNLFDFETNPIITATILVDNSGNTTTVTATINLNDVDEIVVQDANLTINENPSNGDIVGTLQATSNGTLTYTITFQNPAGAFNINQNTGELTVADGSLFDFETNPNMLATISVDNGTYSVSANALVGINDVNEIGEFKYGGVIFWVNPSDSANGLVASIHHQNLATWGCQGTATGATGSIIGVGGTNTTAIETACPTPGTAAHVAINYDATTFSDWFLPSKDELLEMYLNRNDINTTAEANGGTAIPAIFHWSSTEYNTHNAYVVNFSGGSSGLSGKSNSRGVRAVRKFQF